MSFTYESTYHDWPIVAGRAMDVFVPKKITEKVAIFFIHGGGWTGGSRAGMHRIMPTFTDAGFVTATTDYRLNGARITDQVADVRASYAAFQARLRDIGGPTRVVTYGESAGAHLALLLAFAKPGACGEALPQEEPARSLVHEPLAGAAVQSAPTTFEPWDEIFPRIWAAMQAIVGHSYEARPDLYQAVSPIRHVAPGCPPVLLMEAANEHMFPIEYNTQFADAIRAVGGRAEMTIYPHAEHGFFYETTRTCQKAACQDLLTFVRSCALQSGSGC